MGALALVCLMAIVAAVLLRIAFGDVAFDAAVFDALGAQYRIQPSRNSLAIAISPYGKIITIKMTAFHARNVAQLIECAGNSLALIFRW